MPHNQIKKYHIHIWSSRLCKTGHLVKRTNKLKRGWVARKTSPLKEIALQLEHPHNDPQEDQQSILCLTLTFPQSVLSPILKLRHVLLDSLFRTSM